MVSRKVVVIVWLGLVLIMARAFLWLGWLMNIYRELFAHQIKDSPIIVDLPADQASRSFSLILARLSYWS